jgi:5'-nucleotidase
MLWKLLYLPGRLKRGRRFPVLSQGCADRISRRFPVISGFRVSWDSRRPSGQRVLGVWLLEEQADDVSVMSTDSGFTTPAPREGQAISRNDTEPKYKILTREYMAQGHDGFTALKGSKYLIDDESGQITSTVVRKYLLGPFIHQVKARKNLLTKMAVGSKFVRRLARFDESKDHLHEDTHRVIQNERSRLKRDSTRHSSAVENSLKVLKAASSTSRWSRSRRHFRDHIHITSKEHMSLVDCFHGAKHRVREPHDESDALGKPSDEDLLVVHPWADGRLKDEARN